MSEIDPYDELKKQMAEAEERFASEVDGATMTHARRFRAGALAVELGDFGPADRLLQEAEALSGPVRQEGDKDQSSAG